MKLYNLFYVSGGLLAILGFTVDFSDGLLPLGSSDAAVIVAVSAFGLLTSLVSGIALHFGVKYLLVRKAAAVRLEGRLAGDDDCQVVTPRTSDGSGLRVSPTSWLLRLTPYICACAWLALMVTATAG